MIVAERLDRDRIEVLFGELRRLTRREIEVRLELTELLEAPRSPVADAKLGALLVRLGGETQR